MGLCDWGRKAGGSVGRPGTSNLDQGKMFIFSLKAVVGFMFSFFFQ